MHDYATRVLQKGRVVGKSKCLSWRLTEKRKVLLKVSTEEEGLELFLKICTWALYLERRRWGLSSGKKWSEAVEFVSEQAYQQYRKENTLQVTITPQHTKRDNISEVVNELPSENRELKSGLEILADSILMRGVYC